MSSSPSPRRKRTLPDRLTVLAVLLVVVLVSLPRLRSFGLRDNEADAVTTMVQLGRIVHAAEIGGMRPGLLELARQDERLGMTLRGARPLSDGRSMGEEDAAADADPKEGPTDRFLLHGYLFEWRADVSAPVLLAWPWNVGTTGRGVFACPADGRLYGHANRLGLWTGPRSAPPWPPADKGWRLMGMPDGL